MRANIDIKIADKTALLSIALNKVLDMLEVFGNRAAQNFEVPTKPPSEETESAWQIFFGGLKTGFQSVLDEAKNRADLGVDIERRIGEALCNGVANDQNRLGSAVRRAAHM